MAIGASTGVASKKLSGGSWKDAALSGAEGAASGYGGAKGLGPSATIKDKIGSALGKYGISMPDSASNYRTPPFVGNNYGPSDQHGSSYDANDWQTGQYGGSMNQPSGKKSGLSGFIDKLGGAKGIAGIAAGVGGALATKKILNNRNENKAAEANQPQNYNPNPEPREVGVNDRGVSRFQRGMRRELGPIMGQSNQNNPNFALSIGQGRMDAMRDQPFRGGYEVKTIEDYDEDTGNPIFNYREMPRIGPGRRRRQDQYYGQREEAAQ
jgi:hypothetical protein